MSDIEPNEIDQSDRDGELELKMELKNIDAQLNQTRQLQKTQQDLKDAYEKIGQMLKTQRALRQQIADLQANLKTVTDNRHTEPVSSDASELQVNSECQERRSTIEGQVVKLTAERDGAIVALKELQNGNEAAFALHEKEKHDFNQRLDDLVAQNIALNDQMSGEKQKIDKYLAEIASIKQEKSHIESELVTMQKDYKTIFEEKRKLADDIRAIEQSNARISNELKEMMDKWNARRSESELLVPKIAAQYTKYKNLFDDLEKKHNELVAKNATKSLDQTLNDVVNELNSSIVVQQQQNESLRLENEELSKRFSELDAKHAIASNTIQMLTKEKKHSELELMTVKTQSESRIKSLMSENKALRACVSKMHHQLTNTPRAKATAMLMTNARPVAANSMAGPSDQSESITSQQHGKSVQNSQAIVKDTGTSLELSNSPGVTRRRRMARTDENDVDTVPVKRRLVADSEHAENATVSSNGVCKTVQPAENSFFRARPIAELQKQSSSQLHKNDNSTATSGISTRITRSRNDTGIGNSLMETFQDEIDSSAKLIIGSGGKVDVDKLYRCAFPDCNWVRRNEYGFLAHLSIHDFSDNYQCFHCQQRFYTAVELHCHIKIHQKCRYFCFHCEYIGVTDQQMKKHFQQTHTCIQTTARPLNEKNCDTLTDLFVVCPKEADLDVFKKRLLKRASNLKANQRKFHPYEIELLPKSQIFQDVLECALCGFRDKTRQNLVRHFKIGCNVHVQQSQAPINPVNHRQHQLIQERPHFTNGAAAMATMSTSLKQGMYKYVPESDRYRCFARSCGYKNVSSDLFRLHIERMHGSDQEFTCPHCGLALKTFGRANQILNHLCYHGSRIYKCPSCTFHHYTEQQVDKHIGDLHPNVRKRAITLDRAVRNGKQVKWNCNNCAASFQTRESVKTHLFAKHYYENSNRPINQFECTLCQYSDDSKSKVELHLSTEHAEKNLSKVKCNFYSTTVDADNKSDWDWYYKP